MEIKNLPEEQMRMHKDFFDKCNDAVANGFYLEALFLEYAALEGRLEVMLGVLGLPCNKEQPHSIRKSIQISHRLTCLDNLQKSTDLFAKSKLPKKYFQKLNSWINKRNQYVHGLYKDALSYKSRMSEGRRLAEQEYELIRLMYNDTNRIKRLKRNHSECFNSDMIRCSSGKCMLNMVAEEKQLIQ